MHEASWDRVTWTCRLPTRLMYNIGMVGVTCSNSLLTEKNKFVLKLLGHDARRQGGWRAVLSVQEARIRAAWIARLPTCYTAPVTFLLRQKPVLFRPPSSCLRIGSLPSALVPHLHLRSGVELGKCILLGFSELCRPSTVRAETAHITPKDSL